MESEEDYEKGEEWDEIEEDSVLVPIGEEKR